MPDPRRRSMTDMSIRMPEALPLPVPAELMALVRDNAEITRGEGLAMIERAVAKDPSAKFAALLAVLKLLAFGRTEQNLALMADENPKIDCAMGCAACCHQNVDVTVPEAILISLRLADPDDPRRAAILETSDWYSRQPAETQWRVGRACPLLEEQRCSVYEDRPLVCRSVLSPDAKGCHAALKSAIEGGDPVATATYPLPQFLTRGDQAAVQGICKDLGLQHDVVDLVQALALILSDPTAIDRWSEGQTVFEPRPVRDAIDPRQLVAEAAPA